MVTDDGSAAIPSIEIGGLSAAPSGTTVSFAFMAKKAAKIVPTHPDWVADIVQDSALRLLLTPAPDGITNPKAYATHAVRSATFKMLLEEHRQRWWDQPPYDAPLPTAAPKKDDPGVHRAFVTTHESDATYRRLFAGQVLDHIKNSLGPRQLAVAQLLYDGCKIAAIAKHLGISRVTVYKDLVRIRELIDSLDEPPDPPYRGGGGGGGVALPPVRGDPVVRAKAEARRVAALLKTGISNKKEATYVRWKDSQGDDGMPYRGKHVLRPGEQPSSTFELLAEFKGLLLHLPAFREAGLAPSLQLRRPPDNLEQVLAIFCDGDGR